MEGKIEFTEEEIMEFRTRSQDNFFMSDDEVIKALERERAGYKEIAAEPEEVKKIRSEIKKLGDELDKSFSALEKIVTQSTLLSSFVYLSKVLTYFNMSKPLFAYDPEAILRLDAEIKEVQSVLAVIASKIADGEASNINMDAMATVSEITKRMSDRYKFSELFNKK